MSDKIQEKLQKHEALLKKYENQVEINKQKIDRLHKKANKPPKEDKKDIPKKELPKKGEMPAGLKAYHEQRLKLKAEKAEKAEKEAKESKDKKKK